MTTSANSTELNKESEPTSTNSGYKDPEVKPDVDVKDENSNLDENGYEIVPKEDEVKDPEPKEEPAKEEEPVKNPATGYGDEEEILDPKSDEEPAKDGEKTPEDLAKEEIEKSISELPEGYDKDKMSKFVLDNKLTKEQVEAYVKYSQEENSQLKADQDAQIKATRAQWKQELKNDSVFGGELFDKNVDRVEKILDKHMPNMKKVLTDKGGVLPPYIMKDLLELSKTLNPTAKLVNGDPGEKKKEEKHFLDDMYE